MENRLQHRKKLYFLVLAGAAGVAMTILGGFQIMHFMDSTAFCGRLCHEVMYPEFTTYEASPHSRVDCVDCHVGYSPSWIVQSKIRGIPQMVSVIFNTYRVPIPAPVENLRPSRDTCEHCHRPERFAGDLVRVRRHYASDEANTETVVARVLKVGGGGSDAALDIHWHVAANVWYLPLDEKRQEIGWVGVEGDTGELAAEYIDPEMAGEISPELIETEKRIMDCVDCHNRATHIFFSPKELIDSALAQGKIDAGLPFIKREGLKALDPVNSSLEEAEGKIEAIGEFYRTSYPEVARDKPEAISRALEELNEVARLTTFPHMTVSWETHPNNLGHIESPGCQRCHGKLVATSGDREGEVIDNGCTSCHYPFTG